MKKLLSLSLFVLSALVGFGQSFDWIVPNPVKTYKVMPADPTLGSTATITDAVGPTLESGEISPGGRKDILVTGPAYNNSLIPNGLVGTSGAPYRFFSLSSPTRTYVGGNTLTAGQQAVSSLNSSNFTYFYGLGIVGNSSTGVAGISGVSYNALSNGATFTFSNTIIHDVSYAGFQVNSGTPANSYNNININFTRIFGYSIEGEGFYLGNTNTSSYSPYTGITSIKDNLVYNKGRECIQVNGHNFADIKNFTGVTCGAAAINGQDYLLQVQNSNGRVAYSIFDGAPELVNLATHNVTISFCYFRWNGSTSNLNGYVANYLTSYSTYVGYTNPPGGGGSGKILFENCIFDPDNAVTNMLFVDDPNVTIEFKNCIFKTNITNLFFDNRGASNYSLIGTKTTNGNSTLADPENPTYNNLLYSSESTHGLVTNDLYYWMGLGYRSN
jgi:hypothetical protein